MHWFFNVSARQLLVFCAAFSGFMLAAALVAQFGFGLHPCDLCLYQRYPYVAVMVLAGLGAWRVHSPASQRLILWLCFALFLLDAGIAMYHTGVEYGWVRGPDGCSAQSSAGQTLEEMRAAILQAPLVSCSQAMATIFGLSMAAWNALAALGVAALLAAKLWRRK